MRRQQQQINYRSAFFQMPQRGYVFQPTVAVSATWERKRERFSTAKRLRHLDLRIPQRTRNRVAVERFIVLLPRVAEAATLGWKT
jgi:hypothetical protein